MATIKSYTDINQSKKLAGILPLESADMKYREYTSSLDYSSKHCDVPSVGHPFERDIPCWSLAALLEVIGHYTLQTVSDSKRVIIVSENGNPISFFSNPQTVDACYEMILKLNELNLL